MGVGTTRHWILRRETTGFQMALSERIDQDFRPRFRMKEGDMKALARVMVEAIKNHADTRRLEALRQETRVLCSRFPVPGL